MLVIIATLAMLWPAAAAQSYCWSSSSPGDGWSCMSADQGPPPPTFSLSHVMMPDRIPVGEPVPFQVDVTNTGSWGTATIDLSLDGPYWMTLASQAVTIGRGQTKTVSLVAPINMSGPAEVRLSVRDGASILVEANVSMDLAIVSIVPPHAAWAGHAARLGVVVTNTGESNAAEKMLVKLQADHRDIDVQPVEVSPGEHVTVPISWTPLTSGPFEIEPFLTSYREEHAGPPAQVMVREGTPYHAVPDPTTLEEGSPTSVVIRVNADDDSDLSGATVALCSSPAAPLAAHLDPSARCVSGPVGPDGRARLDVTPASGLLGIYVGSDLAGEIAIRPALTVSFGSVFPRAQMPTDLVVRAGGAPIVNASVTAVGVDGSDTTSGVTDANGSVRLVFDTAGDHTVVARRPGYANTSLVTHVLPRVSRVAVFPAIVPARPSRAVHIRAADDAGAPAANATVDLCEEDRCLSALTDASGNATISFTPTAVGNASIAIGGARASLSIESPVETVSLFGPPPREGSPTALQIHEADGAPADGIDIMLTPDDGSPSIFAQANDLGLVTADLGSGLWTATALVNGTPTSEPFGVLVLPPGGEIHVDRITPSLQADRVSVRADVTDTGGKGTRALARLLVDGEIAGEQEVALAPASTFVVEFTSPPLSAGDHDVEVRVLGEANGAKASVRVPPPVAPASPTVAPPAVADRVVPASVDAPTAPVPTLGLGLLLAAVVAIAIARRR